MYICPCHSLTSSQLTLPPTRVLKSILYICISIPVLPPLISLCMWSPIAPPHLNPLAKSWQNSEAANSKCHLVPLWIHSYIYSASIEHPLYVRHCSWLWGPSLTPGLMLGWESEWERWGKAVEDGEERFYGSFPLGSLPCSHHHHLPESQKMRGNRAEGRPCSRWRAQHAQKRGGRDLVLDFPMCITTFCQATQCLKCSINIWWLNIAYKLANAFESEFTAQLIIISTTSPIYPAFYRHTVEDFYYAHCPL